MPLHLPPSSPRLSERLSEHDLKRRRQEEAQAQYERGREEWMRESRWLMGFVYGVIFAFVLMLFLLIG